MSSHPATTRREIELDFIRGIVSPLFQRVQGFGWIGVDVFFVLSGFLVGGLLMKEWSRTGSVEALRFLKRRAFKIWPAYYAFLFVVAAIHIRPFKAFF